MKWKNKGHEFDKQAAELLNEKYDEKFYVFGAGLIGQERSVTLKRFNLLKGYIDNNESKHNTFLDEFQIISFTDYLNKYGKTRIIVCTGQNTFYEIRQQLEQSGLKYKRDFFFHKEFFEYYLPIYLMYKREQMYLEMTQLSLTERCTLKCEKCAHGCYNVSNDSEDISFNEMREGIDLFFKNVDFIREFALIGGEPLLSKNLCDIISYINSNYRNKIGILSITTNGTIIPKDSLIESCISAEVLFRISNYSMQIPRLKENYVKLAKVLEENNLDYVLSAPEKEWWDYGFEYYDRGSSEEELIKTFDSCNTICKELKGNKLYSCIMARCTRENLHGMTDENGYILSEKRNGKFFLEFSLGFSELGYMKMCQFCHGVEAINYTVSAAVQKDDSIN